MITHNPCYTDPVGNLTLSIDDDLLKRARVRAVHEGTSVNAVVRDYLERYAHTDARQVAMQRFLDIAEASDAGSSESGRTWTRGEIYEDRIQR